MYSNRTPAQSDIFCSVPHVRARVGNKRDPVHLVEKGQSANEVGEKRGENFINFNLLTLLPPFQHTVSKVSLLSYSIILYVDEKMINQ